MPNADDRARRRGAKARRSSGARPGGARRQSHSPARKETPDQRPLLERILDMPRLAEVVPRLAPEMLHRVIQRCGLEDCGELVALATPGQLAAVLDADLWRTGHAGRDEQFDAERFGIWLDVLIASGASVAAQKVAAMNVDLVIAGLAQHALVFDSAAVASMPSDGEELPAGGTLADGSDCDVGGYRVVARRTDAWDAIVAVLVSLEAEHPDSFHRVMAGCRSLSNSKPEVDGLHDLLGVREQVLFNLAFDREQRREKQGYVTPPQARAFLQMSRQLRLGYAAPSHSPVATAYFRAIEWTTAEDPRNGPGRLPAASGAPVDPEDSTAAVAAMVDVLVEAGVVASQTRGLLAGPPGHSRRLGRIQAHLQFARDCDNDAYSTRSQELAYLANTIVAGCSIQARAFTAQEASDAAVAVCNLGLENFPPHWLQDNALGSSSGVETGTALPDDFLVAHDLVTVFQVGWTILHEQVCIYAAQRLVRVLADLRCNDRETQAGLNLLRITMAKHCQAGAPWRARGGLDVIAILDLPAWAALLGLIDECPVMHAAIGASRGGRTVSASAFEFISENRQIASIREFMQSLPATLRA